MAVRIDERVARCMALLRSHEFEPLMAYLKAKRMDTLETLAVVTDDRLAHRLQGKAEELKDFIDSVDKAEELMKKLRR